MAGFDYDQWTGKLRSPGLVNVATCWARTGKTKLEDGMHYIIVQWTTRPQRSIREAPVRVRNAAVQCVIFILCALVADATAQLTYRTSWVGNTWGAAGFTFPRALNDMQMRVEAMGVAPDGVVYTNGSWDEAHKEFGAYSGDDDGGVIDLGQWWESGGPGGWENDQWSFNNADGGAVAATDTFVFVTVDRTVNSATQGPGWIRRYRRSTNRPDGFDVQVSTARVEGLAVGGEELFASDRAGNTIKVYSTATLGLLRTFTVSDPGRLAVDGQGNLWVLQASTNRVAKYSTAGSDLSVCITFPATFVAVDLAWNASAGRLMVAGEGTERTVRFYNLRALSGTPTTASSTLGTPGGIMSGVRGQWGPAKFLDLTGVGADRNGNIYVSMSELKRGANIESYRPDGTFRWATRNHGFVETADVDPLSETDMFTSTKHYAIDYSRPAGGEWALRGQTLDLERYPQDPRGNVDSLYHVLCVQRIGGRRFLCITNMYSDYVAIYRFSAATDGEIAIPCAFVTRRHLNGAWPPDQPASGEWIWVDANGDGMFDNGELETRNGDAPADAWGWCVDVHGDIWLASYTQGMRRYAFQGLTADGCPRYDFAHTTIIPMPQPFTALRRVEYLADTDVMWLCGYTAAYPNSDNLWGKGGGRVAARYDNWSTGNRSASVLIEGLQYYKSPLTHHDNMITNISVAGDYLFAQHSRYPNEEYNTQKTEIYRVGDGVKVGALQPGPEAALGAAQIDVPHGMSAFRRANGEYLVMVEDDWHGKVLMYRWCPSGACAETTAAAPRLQPAGTVNRMSSSRKTVFRLDGRRTELGRARRAPAGAYVAKGDRGTAAIRVHGIPTR